LPIHSFTRTGDFLQKSPESPEKGREQSQIVNGKSSIVNPRAQYPFSAFEHLIGDFLIDD
jgi:hypothetical protein